MFNLGVVVKLKSGGPAMTVARTEPNKDVVCTWFDTNDGMQTGTFKFETLRREAMPGAVRPIRKVA